MATTVTWINFATWDGVPYSPGDVGTVDDADVARLVRAHYVRVGDEPLPPITYPDPLPQYALDAELDALTTNLGPIFADAVAAYATDPSVPRFPSTIGHVIDSRLVGATDASRLAADTHYAAVVCNASNSLVILDVSDKASPVVVAVLTDAVNLDRPTRVRATGTWLAIQCHRRLTLVNVANPLAPVVSSSLTDATLPNSLLGYMRLSADGNTAFISGDSSNKLFSLNITNKAVAPAILHTLTDAVNLATARDMYVISPTRLAVMANATDRVTIINTSNLAAMSVAASITDAVLDGPSLVRGRAGRLYVFTSVNGGVHTISITNPDAPTIEGSLVNASYIASIGAMALLGTILLLFPSNTGAIVPVDVSAPRAPALVGGLRAYAGVLFGFSTQCVAVADTFVLQVAPELGRANILAAPDLAPGQLTRREIGGLGHSMFRMFGGDGTSYATTTLESTRSPLWFAGMSDVEPWQFLHNGGSDGETSAEILERLYTASALFRPAVCLVWCNTNDTDATKGISPAQSVANTKGIITEMRRRGSRVVVINVAARSYSTQDVKDRTYAINAGLAPMVAASEGAWLADVFAVTAQGDGTPIAGVLYDNLHFSSTGAQIIAAPIGDAIKAASGGLYLPTAVPLSGTNLAPNATFAGDTAGVADNTVVTGFTPTKVAGGQRLVLGASATGTCKQVVTLTPGDALRAILRLDNTVSDKVTRHNFKFVAGARTAWSGNPAVAAGLTQDDSVTHPIPALGTDKRLRTNPNPLPVAAGVITGDLIYTVTTGAAGSYDGTLRSIELRSALTGA